MYRPLLLASILSAPSMLAQSPNALHFDGVDDRVDCGTAAALDITGTQITLEAWIYPTSWKPNTWEGTIISKDGGILVFTGYMLRAGENGRVDFAFGDGTAWHTIISPVASMTLNNWYHVAATYDGVNSRLFINGALVATGSITTPIASAASGLVLGDWSTDTGRNFPGIVDEVRIWNVARDEAAIAASQNSSFCPNEPGLVAYYRFDQGIAGGDNTLITTLVDHTGTADGTFSGFALTGNTSNFVQGSGFGTDVSAGICPGGTYEFNGELLSEAGSYSTVFSPGGGCDSTVNLTLSVVNVNTTVVQNGVLLTCMNGGAEWQWLDCGNGFASIPGATFQTYTASANGSYAVEVTDDGCADTSACFTVSTVGIADVAAPLVTRLVMDPVNSELVLLMEGVPGMLDLKVQDMQGRILRAFSLPAQPRLTIDVAGLPSGAYVLHVALAGARGMEQAPLKFIKE